MHDGWKHACCRNDGSRCGIRCWTSEYKSARRGFCSQRNSKDWRTACVSQLAQLCVLQGKSVSGSAAHVERRSHGHHTKSRTSTSVLQSLGGPNSQLCGKGALQHSPSAESSARSVNNSVVSIGMLGRTDKSDLSVACQGWKRCSLEAGSY